MREEWQYQLQNKDADFLHGNAAKLRIELVIHANKHSKPIFQKIRVFSVSENNSRDIR